MQEAKERRYLKGYEAYDSRQMAKMAHLERMEDGCFVLFDYKNRDALFGNAAAFSISQDEIQWGMGIYGENREKEIAGGGTWKLCKWEEI